MVVDIIHLGYIRYASVGGTTGQQKEEAHMQIKVEDLQEGAFGYQFNVSLVTVEGDTVIDWPAVRERVGQERPDLDVPAQPTRYLPGDKVSDESGNKVYEDIWVFRTQPIRWEGYAS